MNCKKKNAVSLIVLVVTVIVLSILAATVIINLSNTNIINEASDAVKKTELQQIEEAKALMLADGMFGNNPEAQTIGDYTLIWNNVDKKVTAVANKNVERDGVIIPSGFGYVEGTKNTGLVIEDKDGNQFVWVPVDDYSKFVRGTAEETSSGSGIYKMTGTVSENYSEPYTSNAWEVTEYNAMCASVNKYGGFYIARFEAGDADATTLRTSLTEAHTVVSKKGAIVYSYVPWGETMSDIAPFTDEEENVENVAGAVYLSQNMYKNHESVVSTLCYGVQWDAVMNFVSDADHNIASSGSWGNHVKDIFELNNFLNSDWSIITGANELWKAKNIYDLSGNADEWTMEVYKGTGRCKRGGSFAAFNVGAESRYSQRDVTIYGSEQTRFPSCTVLEIINKVNPKMNCHIIQIRLGTF